MQISFPPRERPATGVDDGGGVRAGGQRQGPLAVALLAGLAVAGLIWAIATVVRQGVLQADAGRRTNALQAEADWRCAALRPQLARERCVVLVRENKPVDSNALQTLAAEAESALSRR